jgi:hypothetical protein
MKHLICFLLLFQGIAFSQNIDLTGTKWVGKQHQFFGFQEKSVSLSDVSFLRQYKVTGTMIEFKHDFSYIEQKTIGDKIIARETYEVPDSRFKISYSPDSITLTAINPAAIYVASTVNQKRHHLKEELFIEWEKTGERPKELEHQRLDSVMTFVSYPSTKNQRQVSAIYLSTSCYNMDRKYYTDLVVDSTGFLHVRTINQGYNNGNKPNFKYFEGPLNEVAFEKLDSLFSFSGMPDKGSLSYSGWASHSLNFDLTITHSKGTVSASGIRSSMPELERRFFDEVLDLIEDGMLVTKSDFVFEQSKFDADANKK